MLFDLQPHLKGELIELRPLRRGRLGQALCGRFGPADLGTASGKRSLQGKSIQNLSSKMLCESGGAFIVIDTQTQQIIGSTRFHGYDPEKSEIEIGWTFLARKYWGGRYNAEMKQLMLRHAFKFVENVVFFVGENNLRSQKATEKIGAAKSVRRRESMGTEQRHST